PLDREVGGDERGDRLGGRRRRAGEGEGVGGEVGERRGIRRARDADREVWHEHRFFQRARAPGWDGRPMDAANPPIARSDDGRSFLVGDATGSTHIAGSLVIVSGGGERQLGLIEERSETQPARLRGRLIGVLTDGALDTARSHPFETGTVEEVDTATIEVLHTTTGALLEVGSNLTDPGGPAKLLPRRFNRHTFWCGQSGSGKTYALGVVLEQLVAHTALPVVIFDPNSDFVRLGELNPDAGGPTAEALAQRDIRVLRARGEDDAALRARFIDMKLPSKAAVLRLDPVADRAEYNSLVRLQDVLAAGEL